MNKALTLCTLLALLLCMSAAIAGPANAQENGLHCTGSEPGTPPKYSGAPPTVNAPIPQPYRAEMPWQQTPVPPGTPKAWALATTALLTEVNRDRHDLLGGQELNPKNIRSVKALLSKWWDVHNRQDLLDALRWVQKEGHRKDFIAAGIFVNSLDDDDYKKLVDKLEQAHEDGNLNRVRILRENFERLGFKNLLGWDYARYIALCRWGYAAGYLSEDEAWERIMPVAVILQKNFESWEDLCENYMIGREYWSYDETGRTGKLILSAREKLLNDPDSPWVLNPWDMDLQGGD